jgi:hypothetical protein
MKCWECIQKFPDWPPGVRTANGTAFCYWVQLYRYFMSQSSEFCRHNPLCCFSTSVYCFKHIFRYPLSPETFGYTPVFGPKRQSVTEGWKTLHNEEPHNLYSSPNVIRIIKPKRMGSVRRMAHMSDQANGNEISDTGFCCCFVVVLRNVAWLVPTSWFFESNRKALGKHSCSLCIVTRLRAGRPGFNSRQVQWWDFFSSPPRPDPPSLLSNRYRRLLTGACKATGAWNWPLTSIYCRG